MDIAKYSLGYIYFLKRNVKPSSQSSNFCNHTVPIQGKEAKNLLCVNPGDQHHHLHPHRLLQDLHHPHTVHKEEEVGYR